MRFLNNGCNFWYEKKTDGRGGSLNFWYVLIGIVIAEVVGWTTDVDCGVSPVVCWMIEKLLGVLLSGCGVSANDGGDCSFCSIKFNVIKTKFGWMFLITNLIKDWILSCFFFGWWISKRLKIRSDLSSLILARRLVFI